MIATFLADLSGHERIEAVHETFAGKSSFDAITFALWALLFVAVMVGLLVLLNRIQQRYQQRSTKRPPGAPPGRTPRSPSDRPFMNGPTTTRGRGPTPRRTAGSRH